MMGRREGAFELLHFKIHNEGTYAEVGEARCFGGKWRVVNPGADHGHCCNVIVG